MSAAALDFWNHPQWLGDSRDNPRDPRHEPFWMRAQNHGYTASGGEGANVPWIDRRGRAPWLQLYD